jgi:hypothetical protein
MLPCINGEDTVLKLETDSGNTGIIQRSVWSQGPITLDELVTRLDAAPRHDPLTLESRDIPSETGIYVWYAKRTGWPAYVGAASGRGLRHRIWAQHLNANYLEGRAQKINQADFFQLGCAVVARGRPCIDKSVFRRNIGRQERIAPGQGTVDYIRQCFEVAWVLLPRSEIIMLERELIARFGAKWNLYNIKGNPCAMVANSGTG